MNTALPQFGERLAGNNYTRRPGAYAVVFDAGQRVAVVKNRYGYYFLLGGGAEPSETMEETLQREVLEESGYDIQIHRKLGEATECFWSEIGQRYFEVHGHFYAASFGQRVREPVDDHHVLVWLTAEEAVKQLCRQSQAWAVRQAVESDYDIRR
ncbi:NUDIX domain-containing protein [candidate division KSB1 bacterium]|nr:NUDIX domain-containing protein [candidate division KSB1 bacterium]